MLSKKKRLSKNKDIKEVIKKGKKFKEKFLILKKKPNTLNNSRLGVVVGLKVSKKATERNKIKRRINEIIRRSLKKIKKGNDVVLIVLSSVKGKNFQQIKKTVMKLFRKAKLIRKTKLN